MTDTELNLAVAKAAGISARLVQHLMQANMVTAFIVVCERDNGGRFDPITDWNDAMEAARLFRDKYSYRAQQILDTITVESLLNQGNPRSICEAIVAMENSK